MGPSTAQYFHNCVKFTHLLLTFGIEYSTLSCRFAHSRKPIGQINRLKETDSRKPLGIILNLIKAPTQPSCVRILNTGEIITWEELNKFIKSVRSEPWGSNLNKLTNTVTYVCSFQTPNKTAQPRRSVQSWKPFNRSSITCQ